MAAGSWLIYGKAKKYLGAGTITLNSGVFKICLLRNSASTLNISALSSRSTWASLKATGVSLLGTCYPQSGKLLATSAGSWVSVSATKMKFFHPAIVFTASGASLKNIRYALIRTSTGADAGRLLCYCALSTAQFSIVSPNTLTITPDATSGVFTLV